MQASAILRLFQAFSGGRSEERIRIYAEALRGLDPDEPLRDVVRAHRDAGAVVEGSPGTLVDVNTPEDYAGALEAFAGINRPS